MERDDLLKRCDHGQISQHWYGCPHNGDRPDQKQHLNCTGGQRVCHGAAYATDADLAALGYVKEPEIAGLPFRKVAESFGYVKLDGIDVDWVRSGSSLLRQCIRPIEGRARELLNDTLDALDQVLAAIDQGDTNAE